MIIGWIRMPMMMMMAVGAQTVVDHVQHLADMESSDHIESVSPSHGNRQRCQGKCRCVCVRVCVEDAANEDVVHES
jgi:hypothetical protein